MASGDMTFQTVGAHTQNSTLSSAQSITVPANASKMLVQAYTQNVRYTLDGTTPTASKGFQILYGDCVMIPVASGQVLKFIEEAASASIDYQFGY